MKQSDTSLSISNPNPDLDLIQKLGLSIGIIGVIILALALFGINLPNKEIFLYSSLALMTIGPVIFGYQSYMHKPAGIQNNSSWFRSLSSKGIIGWTVGILLTAFYILLYWYPNVLGQGENGTNSGLVALFDPLSQFLKGKNATQWFVYGTLYTVAVIGMGIKFLMKYRHNRYQTFRTLSVMFFQLGFAFLIPEILEGLNADKAYFAKNFVNMWPLNYYFFEDWHMKNMLDGGTLGMFTLGLGLAMVFVVSPILTYKYGKRWYCSWVCGCGGLAETAGDPFRHLSDKSLTAWKIERWMIHVILAIITVFTAAVLYTYVYNNQGRILVTPLILVIIFIFLGLFAIGLTYVNRKELDNHKKWIRYTLMVIVGVTVLAGFVAYITGNSNLFIVNSYELRKWYGFFIASAFSGVIGVGFYPILGSRVWCRFGCPMAAILGLQQKFFSRFRITTNGGQCISCGNCSTYCEMGIDVRAYAQKGQDIVRASCVGCGVCSAVCPRGVLRLENASGDIMERATEQRVIHIAENDVRILH